MSSIATGSLWNCHVKIVAWKFPAHSETQVRIARYSLFGSLWKAIKRTHRGIHLQKWTCHPTLDIAISPLNQELQNYMTKERSLVSITLIANCQLLKITSGQQIHFIKQFKHHRADMFKAIISVSGNRQFKLKISIKIMQKSVYYDSQKHRPWSNESAPPKPTWFQINRGAWL